MLSVEIYKSLIDEDGNKIEHLDSYRELGDMESCLEPGMSNGHSSFVARPRVEVCMPMQWSRQVKVIINDADLGSTRRGNGNRRVLKFPISALSREDGFVEIEQYLNPNTRAVFRTNRITLTGQS